MKAKRVKMKNNNNGNGNGYEKNRENFKEIEKTSSRSQALAWRMHTKTNQKQYKR
jgi:hypothetical protein